MRLSRKKAGYEICALVLRKKKKKTFEERHLMQIALGGRIIADLFSCFLTLFCTFLLF